MPRLVEGAAPLMLAVLLLPLLVAAARADERQLQLQQQNSSSFSLHRAFSSSMVLQAEAPTVFGTGKPGSTVRVSIAAGSRTTATVKPDGSWLAQLPPQPASHPQAMGTTVKIDGGCGASCVHQLDDVLFGDVWLCGGQSNSESRVCRPFCFSSVVAERLP